MEVPVVIAILGIAGLVVIIFAFAAYQQRLRIRRPGQPSGFWQPSDSVNPDSSHPQADGSAHHHHHHHHGSGDAGSSHHGGHGHSHHSGADAGSSHHGGFDGGGSSGGFDGGGHHGGHH